MTLLPKCNLKERNRSLFHAGLKGMFPALREAVVEM
jgi:hypothetical protein